LRDEAVFRFTTEAPDLGLEACRQNITDAATDPNHAQFAICDRDARPVGNLAVMRSSAGAMVSYWLAAEARGKGWAAAALNASTEWAFGTWDLDHVDLEIDPANESSIRVARAAGYRRHGLRLESACGGPALLYRRRPND
ncbi:MAG: GNAT family N-acetyltransferase, partial [Acidimicrobiia bacterium]